MALDAGGRRAEAERAYHWLVATQRPDGAWHQYYRDGRVEEATLDANVTAYVATGVWHHFLVTGDAGFLATMWPVVERAMGFVLGLQTARGEVIWARHADGTPWSFALLTASSSTLASLRCAVQIAAALGHERPRWEAGRRPPAAGDRRRARRLPAQGPLGHGLVLPGAGRRRHRRRRPRPPGRRLRPLRHGRPGRPLRRRQGLGHRGRDRRVRHGPPRRRRGRHRGAACSAGPSTCATTTAATSPAWSIPSATSSPPASARPTASPPSLWRRPPWPAPAPWCRCSAACRIAAPLASLRCSPRTRRAGRARTCIRSPCGPKRLRNSTGSGSALPNQCGTRVSNSAASPGGSTRSCSPSTQPQPAAEDVEPLVALVGLAGRAARRAGAAG